MIASHGGTSDRLRRKCKHLYSERHAASAYALAARLLCASARLGLPLCNRGWCLSLRWRLHRIRRLWLGRELQHGPLLACTEMREQHDLSVGKLQCIVMRAGIAHVHLTESCHSVR
jgi:hypothetical protein